MPLVVFLAIYLVGSIVAGDFYKIPITVAGMIASVVAVVMLRGMTLTERVDAYSKGATEPNIMMMIWIFVLAGAFAASTKQMGASDTLSFGFGNPEIPPYILKRSKSAWRPVSSLWT